MWFTYALAFAVISSFSVIVAKKVMRDVDHFTYLLVVSILTAPFLLAFAVIFFDVPSLDAVFWRATLTGTLISVAGSLLVYKAIRESEISLVNPISAFNPVFTAIIAFFILGEAIGFKGFLGIAVVVMGAYVLQISKSKRGLLEPIKALAKHKGVQLSFIAYFLWAITPSFEKTAILHTFPQNPSFAAFVGKTISIFLLAAVALKKSSTPFKKILLNWKLILLDGVFGGVGIAVAFMAYSLAPLGYATAIFKLSVIIVPILGWKFFKEANVKERILGSVIMLTGVILLLI